jgi:GTPase KRas protein
MLVGNKCDRVTEREVSTQEGSALAKELGCDFVEASAKNCVNVDKAFYDVVRQLRRQKQQIHRPSEGRKGYLSDRQNHVNSYRTDRQYRSSKSGRKKKDGSCVIL